MHISDNLKIEESILDGESKYKVLARLMPVGVFSTDKDGLITFYNEKAAELWGRRPKLNDPSELRFCGCWKLYREDGTPMAHYHCPTAKSLRYKKCLRNQEICIERHDGSRLNALVNVDPLFDLDGKLIGALNVFRDITNLKADLENKSLLAAIVESSADAIISKTLDNKIVTWNKGAEKIFGYTSKEIVGKNNNVIIPATHLQEENAIMEKIKKGEKTEHFETIRLTKEGKPINTSITVSPVKNKKGKIIGASKILRDITEKVLIENQLKEYAEKLKGLNVYKDEFMAMASHELKTPLTVIKANLQILEMSLNENPNKFFVDKTINQVNKMAGLISDLLDVTKIQSGGLEMKFADFDFYNLLNETIENIQQTCKTHKISKTNFGKGFRINGDRLRLEHVLVNVLNNAIKYSPSADTIIVSTSHTRQKLIVSVQDFGIGIPAEDLGMVFSRFFRVRGISSTFSGTGIGLYISKNIINRHGGEMWVESNLNEGSIFYFSIPVRINLK